jgi:hypothetical protein
MFELGIGGLIGAYIVIALVLASLHLYSRWHPVIKAGVTALVCLFMVVTYKSLPGLQGWPLNTQELPSRLYLLAVEVSEPDNIFLWARDMDEGATSKARPRAYEFPYSTKLHETAVQAGRKIKRNIAQVVEIDPTAQSIKVPGATEVPVRQSVVRFIDAPQGLLPPKE